jgi:biopolymer transport protein TolQ
MTVSRLLLDASLVVQIVMSLLLLVSLLSWTIIFIKWSVLKKARREADQFERHFWSGADLGELYQRVSTHRGRLSGMESIFESGFREFAHLRKSLGSDPMAVMQGAQRAMRVAMNREIDRLEMHLSFLATVGSTSPYVGLFGTVWGIMNSFMALGTVKQATISSVAPGIAEALIATAMGLFAAIPAVIAYNRYSNDVERLVSRYDIFAEEFSTILQRQVHASRQGQTT